MKLKKMKLIKYNLGCGTDIRDGFINVDSAYIKNVKGKYVRGDITTFKYENADLFLIDNVLEHFTFEDARKLLIRLKSFLKPEGNIIIVVPDFKHLSEVINLLSPNTLFTSNGWCSNCLLGTQKTSSDVHKSFYTQELLKYLCEVSGYNILQWHIMPYEKHGGYHIRAVIGVRNV